MLQREHVASAKARALLQPVLPVVMSDEHAAELAIIHNPDHDRIRIIAVGQNRADVTMRVAMIRSLESLRPVVAGQNTAAVGSQQHTIRVARIDQHIIDNHFRIAYALPGFTAIESLPETFSSACVNGVWIAGILLQNAGSAR